MCKVTKVYTASNGVPCLGTHDGRTVRYPDPLIKSDDTIVFNVESGKIVDFVKFKAGVLVMVTAGANAGRVGEIVDVERHPGSFDICHVKDKNQNTFATRKQNVFIIGRSATDVRVTLPKADGIRVKLTQDRELRIAQVAKQKAGKNKSH